MENSRGNASGPETGRRSDERDIHQRRRRNHANQVDEGRREVFLQRRAYEACFETVGSQLPVYPLTGFVGRIARS